MRRVQTALRTLSLKPDKIIQHLYAMGKLVDKKDPIEGV